MGAFLAKLGGQELYQVAFGVIGICLRLWARSPSGLLGAQHVDATAHAAVGVEEVEADTAFAGHR